MSFGDTIKAMAEDFFWGYNSGWMQLFEHKM